MNRVQIFDTTLRDGEQSPGATMNMEEKLVIARQLERLGVDVIEAGFAASSDGDFEAVRRVASAVTQPIVLSLARTREQDIDRAIKAVEHAKRPGIHIFIATSDIHLKHKLMMSRKDVIDAAVWAVSRAKKHLDYVEFSAEDASRSDIDYLVEVFTAVIAAGAKVINVPDTTGYTLPEEYGALFRTLRERVPGADQVIWSAHCHDDLGMAVANSLAAVQNGVRQIECTVNGIGERAGNTAMEEVVMAIKTRADRFGVDTGVVTAEIFATSRLVSQITGLAVQVNKAVVGENAFAHEAGIHQDGVLKYRQNYEIMNPEDVGLASNRLVLGKHSGRHALVSRIRELGLDATGVDMNRLFDGFKTLADAKKTVYDEDIIALVAQESVRGANVRDRYELVYLNVTSSSMSVPHASVKLRIDGEEASGAATGDGMVDACYKAISDLTGQHPRLDRYAVKAITGGTDAQGEVSCLVTEDGVTVTGQGSHTDIIQASALAYLNALNKLEYRRQHRAQQQAEVGP
ncbi:MAG TPA: 2-isopropylmalate synthase [Candidatus Binatia bacterium]|jgi:2-isopropylmalate synthase|nr:2-isopropylmalate synthase [Candidatus Binatia bacterium]